MGGFDKYNEAIEKYKRASEIASEDGIDDYEIQQKLGDAYFRLGDYSSSISHYNKAINLGGKSFKLWACRSYANEQLLRFETFSTVEREEHDQKILDDRKVALHKISNGNHKIWDSSHHKVIDKSIALYDRAVYHALAHEKEHALKSLNQAIELNTKCLEWAKTEIGFLPLQTDDDFKELMEKKSSLKF